jgi:hypothetical protein
MDAFQQCRSKFWRDRDALDTTLAPNPQRAARRLRRGGPVGETGRMSQPGSPFEGRSVIPERLRDEQDQNDQHGEKHSQYQPHVVALDSLCSLTVASHIAF